jgi:DNA invertase Pin-like site-specific DNA recombinase
MKAFAYLRVSGKDQVDGDGFPRQLAEIKAYAKAHGIRIVRVFEERGVCGETEWENRPAWSELVASLNGVKMILVESLNRLARELFIQEYILRDLKKRGVTLISIREQDIDSSPERILFRQIMGAIAQYDKTMIVMKLRGARQRMKAKMGRCEGAKPYGSLPGEDAVLGEMRRMAADGHSMAAIARELNSRGVMPRRGKAWHPYAVSRMLVAKK